MYLSNKKRIVLTRNKLPSRGLFLKRKLRRDLPGAVQDLYSSLVQRRKAISVLCFFMKYLRLNRFFGTLFFDTFVSHSFHKQMLRVTTECKEDGVQILYKQVELILFY